MKRWTDGKINIKKKTIKKRDDTGEAAASKIGETGEQRESQLLGTWKENRQYKLWTFGDVVTSG